MQIHKQNHSAGGTSATSEHLNLQTQNICVVFINSQTDTE